MYLIIFGGQGQNSVLSRPPFQLDSFLKGGVMEKVLKALYHSKYFFIKGMVFIRVFLVKRKEKF